MYNPSTDKVLLEVMTPSGTISVERKDFGRRYCTVQAIHCALLSSHHMCNSTHTKASERIKRVWSDSDKYSDHQGMEIIWFNNILGVPDGNYARICIKKWHIRSNNCQGQYKKQNLASGVGVGKDRAPYAPSIAPTAAHNNQKEIPPTGVFANIFVARK